MNCCLPPLSPRRFGSNRGSALVIMLVLLSVMATLLISNSVALRRLRVELQLLEEKQKRSLAERSSALAHQPADTQRNAQ